MSTDQHRMNLADIALNLARLVLGGQGREGRTLSSTGATANRPRRMGGVPNFEPNTTDYKMHPTLLSFAAVL